MDISYYKKEPYKMMKANGEYDHAGIFTSLLPFRVLLLFNI